LIFLNICGDLSGKIIILKRYEMKKVLTVIFIILISAAVSFSSEKMPADVKIVTDKITKITANYYKSAGKVKSAKELAAVINKYSSEMEKLAPQIKALEAKYGNMDDDADADSNDDMTSTMKDYEMIQEEWAKQMSGADFSDSIVKIQQYYSDPAVQKALQKLSKVMEDMGVSDEDDEDGDEE
jgi:Icc-related predicted phosphoesterase